MGILCSSFNQLASKLLAAMVIIAKSAGYVKVECGMICQDFNRNNQNLFSVRWFNHLQSKKLPRQPHSFSIMHNRSEILDV